VYSSFRSDPVSKASDAGVDARMLLLRAVETPAGDAAKDIMSGLGEADQRAARVALTRILAAFRVPGAEHVAGHLVVVPVLLVAQIGADDRDVHLVQELLVTSTCDKHHTRRSDAYRTTIRRVRGFTYLLTYGQGEI